ncbi:hypothetical protein GCM10028819_14430 [Spirosoma humi]
MAWFLLSNATIGTFIAKLTTLPGSMSACFRFVTHHEPPAKPARYPFSKTKNKPQRGICSITKTDRCQKNEQAQNFPVTGMTYLVGFAYPRINKGSANQVTHVNDKKRNTCLFAE